MKTALIEDPKDEREIFEGEVSDEDPTDSDRPIYAVFSETIDSPHLGRYTAYGINATDANGNLLKSVSDITCDRAALEALAELCNQNDLSLCHLDDVIEDFLC